MKMLYNLWWVQKSTKLPKPLNGTCAMSKLCFLKHFSKMLLKKQIYKKEKRPWNLWEATQYEASDFKKLPKLFH